MIWIVIYLIGYVIAHGLDFGYFQKEYPMLAERDYGSDFRRSILRSSFSWISVIALFSFGIANKRKFYWKIY